ncbi:MAG: hypothetical protein H6Q33_1098 [Deltaproteobacteria bacterium]|nr:hypothetical protein [Deltaproteobacteria bacterium]
MSIAEKQYSCPYTLAVIPLATMSKRKLVVWGYTCERCGYQWIQRTAGAPEPKVCANRKCKSPYWNKPRQHPAPAKKRDQRRR